MKKIKITFLICLLGLLLCASASASEISGTLTTGLETGIYGTVVVAPTANPGAGTYTASQSVSLSAPGSLSVCYTTDSTNPNCSTSTIYSGPVTISETTTLKAISCYANGVTSSVSTFEYTVEAATYAAPTASPSGGTYTSSISVTLTADGSDSIRYTADGTTPNCTSGATYGGGISVSTTQTIKAIACYGTNSSSVTSFTYTINITSSGGGGGGGGGSSGGSSTGSVDSSSSSGGSYELGDIDEDGSVDEYDFAGMMSSWELTDSDAGFNTKADLNNDGVIDEYDFAILMLHWGN